MKLFQLTLRMAAATMIAVGACHAVLGLSAERILDPGLPVEVLRYASLDSQDRFYGTMFGAAGAALWLCAADPRKYDPIVRCLLWGLLLSGIARIGGVLRNGWPPSLITVLLVIELVAAPAVLVWQRVIRRGR